jgi:hypothetical protein
LRSDQHNIRCGKRWAQLEPTLLLVCGELRHRLSNARQLLGWSQSVRTLRQDSFAELSFETSNPHHKKFVEIVRGYRQKAHTLK